jgi:hypothetical protein
MFRSFIPFLLAGLGFTLIAFAINTPLFEWQISEVVTDFPPTYNVDISPSPWRAHLGDTIDDGIFNYFGGVWIRRDEGFCSRKDLNFVVTRSQNDKTLEHVLNINPKIKPWLFAWVSTEVLLSITYIILFVLEYKHGSNIQAIAFMGFAGFICVFLIQVMRLFGTSFPYYFFRTGFDSGIECHGTIAFNAVLSKVHYETLLVFWTGILAELGAIGVVVRQIRRAISEGKETSTVALP